MIDEPFWSSGSSSSTRPVRGPEPISTRSLAIFVSETATTLSAPCSSTRPSRLPCASNRSRGAAPSAEAAAHAARANSGWVLRPVPVAVPPSGICSARPRASLTRSRPSVHLRRVAAELLAERHGHGVHHVRAARLDHVGELVGLGGRGRRPARSSAGSRSLADLARRPRGARPRGTRRSTTAPCSRGRWGGRRRPRASAITSLAFMLVEVPEPVWKTSIGNWSSCSPAATSSPAAAIRSASSASSRPSSALTRAASALMRAEPAHHGRRDPLTGHREVVHRLARLRAPELLHRRHAPPRRLPAAG